MQSLGQVFTPGDLLNSKIEVADRRCTQWDVHSLKPAMGVFIVTPAAAVTVPGSQVVVTEALQPSAEVQQRQAATARNLPGLAG